MIKNAVILEITKVKICINFCVLKKLLKFNFEMNFEVKFNFRVTQFYPEKP